MLQMVGLSAWRKTISPLSYINSNTTYFEPVQLQNALRKHDEIAAWQLAMVDGWDKQKIADVIIEIDRPFFTYTFTYKITHQHTGIILATGKVTASTVTRRRRCWLNGSWKRSGKHVEKQSQGSERSGLHLPGLHVGHSFFKVSGVNFIGFSLRDGRVGDRQSFVLLAGAPKDISFG